ncbi:MAG: hypothetical protein M5R36_12960 [Deltaproteobacteria bacterium]|nr:hypothetical protein [Deltaproteobacteria bacterium]
MNLAGGISGHFSLYFDRQNRRNNQGDLDLYIDGMKITQARVLGNEIPDVNFKPSSIKLDFRSTGFTIEEWELEADNLSVSMVGRITLAEKNEKQPYRGHVESQALREAHGQIPGARVLAITRRRRLVQHQNQRPPLEAQHQSPVEISPLIVK